MAETIQITGIADVQRALQEKAALVVPMLGIALQQEADAILEVIKTLVPVLTGALKNSGRVGDIQHAGTSASVDITYGGPSEGSEGPVNVQYAAKIEFDITLNHPRGGQSYYLSMPFFQAEQGLLQRLADALVAAL